MTTREFPLLLSGALAPAGLVAAEVIDTMLAVSTPENKRNSESDALPLKDGRWRKQ